MDLRAGMVLPEDLGRLRLSPDTGLLPMAIMEGADAKGDWGVSVGPADRART